MVDRARGGRSALRPGAAGQRRRRHRRLPGRHPARLRAGPADRDRRSDARGRRRRRRRRRARARTATRPTSCRCPRSSRVLEGGAEPRYPTVPGRMKAKKVQIEMRRAGRGPRAPAGCGSRAAAGAQRGRGDRPGPGRGAGRRRRAASSWGWRDDPGARRDRRPRRGRGLPRVADVRPRRSPGGPAGSAARRPAVGAVRCRTALVDQLGAHGAIEVHHAAGDAFPAYGGAAWASGRGGACSTTARSVVAAGRHPARHGGRGPPGGAAGRGDGGERRRLRGPGAVRSSPGRSPAGRCSRRCGWRSARAVFTVAGHAVEARPAAEPDAGDAARVHARRSPRPSWWRAWCRPSRVRRTSRAA